jgi:hypothetical protein
MIQVNLFLNEIYSFLRTVSIKNVYIADYVRSQEIIRRNVDIVDDVDNPYYINLLGDYSVLDTEMIVKSLDIQDTEILFSKAALLDHPKTAFAYQIPGPWHDNLVTRFPLQQDLIKNILYPVPLLELTAAEASAAGVSEEVIYLARREKTITHIAALPNFSLLQYDITQLEPQESSSLIEALHAQLKVFQIRWDVSEFKYEEFFPITLWTVIWTTLPTLLLSQRIKNLRTTSVHTTHIWEYLTSKGLGDYRSILTHEQEMFLYKNMDYLIKTRGKDGTLSILADELLKTHNVTLRSKSLIYNKEDMVENGVPVAEVISSDIRDNTSPSQDGLDGFETVEQIFIREHADGLEPILSDDLIAIQEERFSHMKESWLPTKLVELNRIDLYSSEHNNFVKFVFQSILYRQHLGTINYNIVIRASDTEIDLSLSPGEVIALIVYATEREFNQKSIMTEDGIELYLGLEIIDEAGETVLVTEGNKLSFVGTVIEFRTPKIIPNNARLVMPYLDVLPNETEIEEDFVYSGVPYRISQVLDIPSKIDRIASNIGSINSADEFLELLDGQFSILNKDLEGIRSSGNATYHIAFDKLYSQLLVNGLFDMNLDIPHTTYEEWFDSNVQIGAVIEQIDETINPNVAYAELANDLILALIPLEDATSTVFSSFTNKDFRLMRQLFIQLCSYNISFLDTDQSLSSYLRFTPIVIRDQVEQLIDRETSFELPDLVINNTKCIDIETKIESNANVSGRSFREVVRFNNSIALLDTPLPDWEEEVFRAITIPLFQRQRVVDKELGSTIRLPTSFDPQDTVTGIEYDVDYINSIIPNYIKPGLQYKYYDLPVLTNSLPDFGLLTPVYEAVVPAVAFTGAENSSDFAVVYEGFVMVTEEDIYTFSLTSVDGSRLYIDDYLLIDKDGVVGPYVDSNGYELILGLHKIRVEMFVRTSFPELELSWMGGDLIGNAPITSTSLFNI